MYFTPINVIVQTIFSLLNINANSQRRVLKQTEHDSRHCSRRKLHSDYLNGKKSLRKKKIANSWSNGQSY